MSMAVGCWLLRQKEKIKLPITVLAMRRSLTKKKFLTNNKII